jgi:hypothetical protein
MKDLCLKNIQKYVKKGYVYSSLAAVLLLFPACNDSFDDHYPEPGDSEQDKLPSLWELIKENKDLSIFAGMLEQTGYDRYLASDQTYTVFAPVNDALALIDPAPADTNFIPNMLKTHIARFSWPAPSTASSANVVMINGKIVPLVATDSKVTVGSREILQKNRRAKNGIIHTVNATVPFQKNVWEMMMNEEMDSIRNFFYKFNYKYFNRNSSTIVDYQDGFAVYDSIFFESNRLFSEIGYLNDEDSTYTMILPTNKAWREAYEERKEYFVFEDDSVQHINTQLAIVQDLVFRGRFQRGNFIPGDTLFSTVCTPFRDPESLFEGSTQSVASNGLVYQTDQLHYNPWDSWQPEIVAEAEQRWSDVKNVVGPFVRKSDDTLVSKNRYLAVIPQSATQGPVVNIYLPFPRSARYNIYAVFVPEYYEYPADTLGQARINFQVQQADISTLGKPIDQQVWKHIKSEGVDGGNAWITPPDPLTSTKEVKKMLLVENFKFPRAGLDNIYISTRLAITNVRLRSDSPKYFQYRMFIDRIILEPVGKPE